MLTQFLSSTGGGGEVMFYQLASGLATKGHEIHIVTHRILNPDKRNINNMSGKMIVYSIFPPLKHKGGLPATIIQNLFYVLNAVRCGAKIIRGKSIDLIHANNYSSIFAGFILSMITKRLSSIIIINTE